MSTSSRKIGPMVPLLRAVGAPRLGALDPAGARRRDVARKYRAVVSGRALPRRRAEPSGDESKYKDGDE